MHELNTYFENNCIKGGCFGGILGVSENLRCARGRFSGFTATFQKVQRIFRDFEGVSKAFLGISEGLRQFQEVSEPAGFKGVLEDSGESQKRYRGFGAKQTYTVIRTVCILLNLL